jgi:hypothetical protein
LPLGARSDAVEEVCEALGEFEMTGDFHVAAALMLAVGISIGISKSMYGTIYTTKLLRRGVDIDRPCPEAIAPT